jgi:hypothetical protein
VSLASITIELFARKNERRKQSKRKSSKEHNKSLSLITKALCGIGEDLITLVCLELNARAIVSSWKVENLDAMNVGVVGVFIAPTTKNGRWKCVVAWRTGQFGAPPDTVRCASHISRLLGFDRCSSDLWARLSV